MCDLVNFIHCVPLRKEQAMDLLICVLGDLAEKGGNMPTEETILFKNYQQLNAKCKSHTIAMGLFRSNPSFSILEALRDVK